VRKDTALLFAGPAKLVLEQLELVMQDTYLGLDSAVTAFTKVQTSQSMKPKMNQFSKMCRHLAAATNLERHFTANGADKWLHKACGLLQELTVDQQAAPLTEAAFAPTMLNPDSPPFIPEQPTADRPFDADANTIKDLEQKVAALSAALDAAAARSINDIEALTDRLPAMIDLHLRETVSSVREEELVAVFDSKFNERFMEIFPPTINVATSKFEKRMDSLSDEMVLINKKLEEMAITDGASEALLPGIHLAVRDERDESHGEVPSFDEWINEVAPVDGPTDEESLFAEYECFCREWQERAEGSDR